MRDYKNEFELRDDLKNDLGEYLEHKTNGEWMEDGNDNIDDIRDVMIEYLQDNIFQIIDDYCIYYHTCTTIVSVLGFYSWEDNELGMEVKNICDASVCALYEYVSNEGLIYDIVDAYIGVQNIEELIDQQ